MMADLEIVRAAFHSIAEEVVARGAIWYNPIIIYSLNWCLSKIFDFLRRSSAVPFSMKNFSVQYGAEYNEFRICLNDIIDREHDNMYACYLYDSPSIAPTKSTKAFNILKLPSFGILPFELQYADISTLKRRNDEANIMLWSKENPRGIYKKETANFESGTVCTCACIREIP